MSRNRNHPSNLFPEPRVQREQTPRRTESGGARFIPGFRKMLRLVIGRLPLSDLNNKDNKNKYLQSWINKLTNAD